MGTPPNLSLARIYQITFPEAPPIAFGQWILLGLPVTALMLAVIWLMITQVFYRVPADITVDSAVLDDEMRRLGPPTFEQRAVMAVFATTAVLWVFRRRLDIGIVSIPGWSELLPNPELIDDGTIAITMASLLFLIPTRTPGAPARRLMGPDVIPRLPWNIVLLFGGGFALAHGFQVTGLSEQIGTLFVGLSSVPPLPPDRADLLRPLLPDRVDVEHGDHGDDSPDPGGGRRRRRGGSAHAHDSGYDLRLGAPS